MSERKTHFSEIISSAAAGGGSSARDIRVLKEVVDTWPWFTTARLLLSMETGQRHSLLRLHLHAYPRPMGLLTEVSASEFGPTTEKITPKTAPVEPEEDARDHTKRGRAATTTDDDLAQKSVSLQLSDELLSEELAEIYLAQELNDHAKEIYRRLSLLNPEKSVYFAEIISRIASPGEGK